MINSMSTETYWVALGRGGTYAQSLIHLPQWRDSAMKDNSVTVLLEIKFDQDMGTAEVNVKKNRMIND